MMNHPLKNVLVNLGSSWILEDSWWDYPICFKLLVVSFVVGEVICVCVLFICFC